MNRIRLVQFGKSDDKALIALDDVPSYMTIDDALELAVEIVFLAAGDMCKRINNKSVVFNMKSKFLLKYAEFMLAKER